MEPITTVVSVGSVPPGRKGIPNITLQNARFFGRPNFSGIEDRFKDTRRKFTVLIPNDLADQLREMGYNVKTDIPTQEELKEFPDRTTVSHLKVMVDDGSDVYIRLGEDGSPERIPVPNFGLVDKTRFENWDCEIRGWNYNEDEVRAGVEEPKYSARLVMLVGTVTPNVLTQKYGAL
jgi:hypothetical protein